MRGKRILLGITGGIAAYKIAFLIRLLKKEEAEVKCIMTPASCDFISPLVVSALSGNPVGIEFWNKEDGTWNNHVAYGLWADVFLIAPLTANTLSKMVVGSCDNLLLASYFSMRRNTIIAPAMDLDMYAHKTVQKNLKELEKDGIGIIPVEEGELASGLIGEGRMAEPETILEYIKDYFKNSKSKDFSGKSILVTAGPTYEAIDPVRFIGNHSSGKMGYAIASEFSRQGANVTLISGPVNISINDDRINVVHVTTANEMLDAVKEVWSSMDIGVFAAAVADYRPKSAEQEKIKKTSDKLTIDMLQNPDILKWAGEQKSEDQCLVGFALETKDLLKNSTKKLEEKNLNIIVMNSLKDKGAGFGGDTNKISILDNRNKSESFELKSKSDVARDILHYVKKYIQ